MLFKGMIPPEGADGSQTLTAWSLVLLLLAVGIYDIYLGTVYGEQATITAYVRAISVRWPIIPLVVGVLIGHLFWGK